MSLLLFRRPLLRVLKCYNQILLVSSALAEYHLAIDLERSPSWRPISPLNLRHSLRVTLAHLSLILRCAEKESLVLFGPIVLYFLPPLINFTLSLGGQLVVSALTCMFSSHLPSHRLRIDKQQCDHRGSR